AFAWRTLLCFHVIAKQRIHVAHVEFAVGDDHVGPLMRMAEAGRREMADFLVRSRAGFNEGDGAIVFIADIEMAIGIADGAFADTPFSGPFYRSGQHILTDPLILSLG